MTPGRKPSVLGIQRLDEEDARSLEDEEYAFYRRAYRTTWQREKRRFSKGVIEARHFFNPTEQVCSLTFFRSHCLPGHLRSCSNPPTVSLDALQLSPSSPEVRAVVAKPFSPMQYVDRNALKGKGTVEKRFGEVGEIVDNNADSVVHIPFDPEFNIDGDNDCFDDQSMNTFSEASLGSYEREVRLPRVQERQQVLSKLNLVLPQHLKFSSPQLSSSSYHPFSSEEDDDDFDFDDSGFEKESISHLDLPFSPPPPRKKKQDNFEMDYEAFFDES